MGLFNKLFFRRANSDAELAKALIRKAWEDSGKPQGAYKAAMSGAEIRGRFFTVIEEVEAKLGGPAIGIASAEGVLMVHPKLEEELRDARKFVGQRYGHDIAARSCKQSPKPTAERRTFLGETRKSRARPVELAATAGSHCRLC